MNKKIYQVFISSTYTDLKDERLAIQRVLISSDCLPIGMEEFPSSNLEQFEYIKRVLRNVDYYILVIGGRYGSVNKETGLSYTEMEYDYALEQGIPILTFLKDDSAISKDKMDENGKKLERFIEKATSKRLRGNTFKDINELKLLVFQSISSEKKFSPRPGWIRADFGDPMDLVLENNKLMKENEELRKQVDDWLSTEELENEIELLVLEGRKRTMNGSFPMPYFSKDAEFSVKMKKNEIINILGSQYLKNGTLNSGEVSDLIVASPNLGLKGLSGDSYYILDTGSEEKINRIVLINDIFLLEDNKFILTANGRSILRHLDRRDI